MPFSFALLELLVSSVMVALCAVLLGTMPDTEATGAQAAWLPGCGQYTRVSVHPRPSKLQLDSIDGVQSFPYTIKRHLESCE